MKKIISLFLIVLLAFSVISCGDEPEGPNNDKDLNTWDDYTPEGGITLPPVSIPPVSN